MRCGHYDIPPQQILTRDSVTVIVDGVVFYKVRKKIQDFEKETSFLPGFQPNKSRVYQQRLQNVHHVAG